MTATDTVYRVILEGDVLPEHPREQVIGKLAELFHSSRETAEQLLQGKAVALKKPYTRLQAEKICRAIRNAGAVCRMEIIDDDADEKTADNADNGDKKVSKKAKSRHSRDDIYAALLDFIAVNRAYYARQFSKFGVSRPPTFVPTWNWPAFFAFYFWALYRRMWIWAAVNLIGGIAIVLLLGFGWAYLAWQFAWPVCANYLYYRHARAQIAAGNRMRGGVSVVGVYAGVMLMVVASAPLNNIIGARVLQQYAAQIGEFLPPPHTRQRGDGAAIDDLAALEPAAAKTATWLGILARRWSGNENLPRDNQTISVEDAWGEPILIRRDASGRAVLVSAGADGTFDTADDLLQFIPQSDAGNKLVQ